MASARYELGSSEEVTHPDSIRACLAEFVATFIFVFAGEGTVLALGKIYEDTYKTASASRLVATALAHAFSLFTAVAVSINVSGGHVNPAVTFGALVGGKISLLRAFLYWVSQLLGSVVASLLLRLVTAGMRPVGFSLAFGIQEWHGLLAEIAMTFGLVYTVYATAIDHRSRNLATIAPLAIGLIVGANILVGGPFAGASMNPARAFGPSLVGWTWRHHWIYWVGPFVGAGLAGLIYQFMVIPPEPTPPPQLHRRLIPEDY